MPDSLNGGGFETHYEWLRPAQLVERRTQCPLILFPLGPLEYHGPHLPLGMDPINAERVAHACCAQLRRGVVRPTMYLGTERERDADTLESLGFRRDDYIVGMDFPARLWNSHYLPEEVFALTVAAETRCLIAQGYERVFIVNGHGAINHNQVLRRICVELSHTTTAQVTSALSFTSEGGGVGATGHADIAETSLLMYYRREVVDLGTLPPRKIPLKYADFSIVDGAGFTPASPPAREVPPDHDPRDASAGAGQRYFEKTVRELCGKIEELLAQPPR